MPDSHYDLVIQHHASVEPVDRLVRDLLILLDKEGDPYIEYKLSEGLLFPESKTAILENISKDEAEYYQKRFREMMVETSLRPTLQLSVEKPDVAAASSNDMHVCPACHHQQPRNRSGMNTCQNCNLVAEKYQRNQKREDIIAQESRIYKFQQDKLMREALERARVSEEEQLRREARLRLSLESKKRPLDIAIGVSAVALMVLAGILIVTTIQRKENQNLEDAQQQALIDNALQKTAKPADKTTIESEEVVASTLTSATSLSEKPSAPVRESIRLAKDNQIVTQEDIDKLKTLLETDAPNPYLTKTNAEQFKHNRQKLRRLLELNKPDLAIAFVNELTDQYAAALLLLDVANSEIQQDHHGNEGDILRTFNHLMSRAPAIQQPLVSASFSLMLHLQGQEANAQAILKPTLDDLKATDNSLLFVVDDQMSGSGQVQKLSIILQIIKDYHHFAQTELTQGFMQIAEDVLKTTPTEALPQAEAMTLLAAACLVVGQKDQAQAWLSKITDNTAREQLLNKLNSL
ncbi:hypothetical protein [uncultured Thiothrix sp.]|uniref:hypothetical protein n=1 Tax=uncultured Thiothrix sp. TaxID=223185 RepID=UPI00261C6167|nr:hypothetical protein [uncultured Thiothrix sp.]